MVKDGHTERECDQLKLEEEIRKHDKFSVYYVSELQIWQQAIFSLRMLEKACICVTMCV